MILQVFLKVMDPFLLHLDLQECQENLITAMDKMPFYQNHLWQIYFSLKQLLAVYESHKFHELGSFLCIREKNKATFHHPPYYHKV